MGNSAPPHIGENAGVEDFMSRLKARKSEIRATAEEQTPDSPLQRRREDTADNLDNVVTLKKEGIRMRRKTSKPGPSLAKPKPDTPPEPEVPSSIPAIARGKRVEDAKVAAGVDHKLMSNVTESSRLEKIAGYVDLSGDSVSPEDTARALLALRDEDLHEAYSDVEHTFDDDDDLFIPVAQVALLMFPRGSHARHLDDSRIESIVRVARDPDTMFQRLLGILKFYAQTPISGKRVPAVIKGRGRKLE